MCHDSTAALATVDYRAEAQSASALHCTFSAHPNSYPPDLGPRGYPTTPRRHTRYHPHTATLLQPRSRRHSTTHSPISPIPPSCAMQFRPCIDLRNGRVTQIVGSTLTSTTPHSDTAHENFVSPLPSSHFASLYLTHSLPGGHVIMLGPGNDDAARLALSTFPLGLQVGGGISHANAQAWLDAGASHVIVTSHLFVDGQLSLPRLTALSSLVSPSRLVIDLSCRRRSPSSPYFVVTDRWQTFTSLPLTPSTLRLLSPFCAEFLVHGVDVEGKRQGIEGDLIELLADGSGLEGEEGEEGEEGWRRVVYAGGVRDMEDVRTVERLGKGRVDVSVGSALDIFGGSLSFEEVVAHCKRRKGEGG